MTDLNQNGNTNSDQKEAPKKKTDWQKMTFWEKITHIFHTVPMMLFVLPIAIPLLIVVSGPLFIISAFTDEMITGKKILYILIGILLTVALIFVMKGMELLFSTY